MHALGEVRQTRMGAAELQRAEAVLEARAASGAIRGWRCEGGLGSDGRSSPPLYTRVVGRDAVNDNSLSSLSLWLSPEWARAGGLVGGSRWRVSEG